MSKNDRRQIRIEGGDLSEMPTAIRRSNEDESTRIRILRISAELFAEHPYSDVTMRRIAAAVGIKAPSIYNYYSAKEEIFDELMTLYRDRLARFDNELLQGLNSVEGTLREKLRRMVYFYLPEELPLMRLLMKITLRNQFSHPIARELVLNGSLTHRTDSFIRYIETLRGRGEFHGSANYRYYAEILVRLGISYATEFVMMEDEEQERQRNDTMEDICEFLLDKLIGEPEATGADGIE